MSHNPLQEWYKGDHSDRNNSRGISLLCNAGKLFTRVAVHRLNNSSLSGITLNLDAVSAQTFDSGYDLLSEATSGEVPRATTALLHRI